MNAQEVDIQHLKEVAGGEKTYAIWQCDDCSHKWESLDWEKECPNCKSEKIHAVGTHVHW